ncbi:dihydrouridine synthase-domain-containing protein [Mrakia frigida]|uniref:tRNA-dihydrouridine synthase family protein n=1 Tax=Mrakia frigida TaxID=29902 RepID=UPI003FCC22A3
MSSTPLITPTSSSSDPSVSVPSLPSTSSSKLQGYDLYRSLGSPRHVLAPMVDASELAWRIFSRTPVAAASKGKEKEEQNVELASSSSSPSSSIPPAAELCYTPMINAKFFGDLDIKNSKIVSAFDLVTADEGSEDPFPGFGVSDRPLIAQFCANDPDSLLASAKRIQHRCDAVDLNLGCPQGIAKKGMYGAFLMEDWDLIFKLVNILHVNLDIPVTAKFRVFDTTEKTVEYALMLERAGAQILTCHGRTREMKGHNTGLADWEKIRAVKQAVKVPVFANGNVLYYEDIQKCLDFTGCDGVMSAEGNLYNPSLFLPPPFEHSPVVPLAHRYLDVVASLESNTLPSAIKGHLFKIFGKTLEREDMREVRDKFSRGFPPGPRTDGRGARLVEGWRVLIDEVADIILAHIATLPPSPPDSLASEPSSPWPVPKHFPLDPITGLRIVPFWLSQPHTRPLATPLSDDASVDPSSTTQPNSLHCSSSTLTNPCTNLSATLCETSSCLTHCRLRGARASPSESGYPSEAEIAAMDAKALKALKTKEWEGFGCESHEAKVRARKEAKVMKNADRNAKKREKALAAAAEREAGKGKGKGKGKGGQAAGGKKRKGKGGSGSEGEGPVLAVKEGVVAKKGKGEEDVVVEGVVVVAAEEEEEEMAAATA